MRREPGERADAAASAVIQAGIEVHRHLGPGLLESVYESALSFELERRGIPHARQKVVDLFYKSERVGLLRLDLLVDDCLIVEIKSVEALLPIHRAQLLTYLRGSGIELGLLMNFHGVALREGIRRVVCSHG